MTTAKYPISYEEACKLLGLSSRKKSTAIEIEQAYLKEVEQWSAKLSTTCRRPEGDRVVQALRLLQEAKIMLTERAARRSTRNANCTQPAPAPKPSSRSPSPSGATPAPKAAGTSGSGSSGGKRFSQFFFSVIRAIPVVVTCFVRALRRTVQHLETRGIPFSAIMLGALFGCLFIVHGCGKEIHHDTVSMSHIRSY